MQKIFRYLPMDEVFSGVLSLFPGNPGRSLLLTALIMASGFFSVSVDAQPSDVVLEFDGADGYVEIPHASALDPEDDHWTCEFWVRVLERVEGADKFIAKRHRERGVGAVGFYLGNRFAPNCDDGIRQNFGFGRIPLDEWVHIAVQIDRDEDKFRAYMNGELVSEGVSGLTGSVASSSDLIIGGDSLGRLQGYHCQISHVRIWKGVHLTQEMIRNNMHNKVAGDAEGLAGYWPLDDGRGGTARDISVNRNDGILTGEQQPKWMPARAFARNLPDEKNVQPGQDAVLGPVMLHEPEGEVTYQWYFNGEPIADAEEPSLTIQDVTTDHLGVYYVKVNDDREVTPIASNHMELPPWPLWRSELEGKIAERGDTVTLGPVELYAPRGEVSYQWFRDGNPIEGATGNSLRIEGVREEDLGVYYVRVDDEQDMTPVTTGDLRLAEAPAWPMWRYDAARSASAPQVLEEDLHLHWVRELPEPKRAWPQQQDDGRTLQFDLSYAPVAAGRRVFVPSSVTDSVTAYCIEDGSKLWRYYANGPVRLAPAVWRGNVYFVSDDGHLYCVDADSGELEWKFRGGPSDHRLLGNARIINFWPARGAPAVKDGRVYFAAGIWPFHGVFVYALDAASGDVEWVSDTNERLVPQGYIAAGTDKLVVAGGRSAGYYFNRHTGELLERTRRGYEAHAVDGGRIGEVKPRSTSETTWYLVHRLDSPRKAKVNPMLQSRLNTVKDRIEGTVFYKLAAYGRMIVSTECGKLYCFGPEEVEPQRHAHNPLPLEPEGGRWAEVAESVLDELESPGGYALMLGAGSGGLLKEILNGSDLHVVVVESDEERVRELRDRLAESGRYGRRAAVIKASPSSFSVQPYLFNLVISEDIAGAEAGGEARISALLNWLMPYSGVAWLGASSEDAAALAAVANSAGVDRVSIEAREDHLFATRDGPLTGAGEWTHQWHCTANTLTSLDSRVRLPLGLLWFGGPTNHNILPRHARGPRPQVAGGRLVFLGPDTIAARCVYSGRHLWERGFHGIGGPFDTTSHQAGTAYIGSPFVTLPDSIYLRHDGIVHRLDPATGDTLAEFEPPGRALEEIYAAEKLDGLMGLGRRERAPDWGHISVQGDFLITTSEPHMFEGERLGDLESHSGSSSRLLAVMNRYNGDVLWQRKGDAGFRHNAIISSGDVLFAVDGLSEGALAYLARRGKQPEDNSQLMALDIRTGKELWVKNSEVFATFLLYSDDHDILVEGGSYDLDNRRIRRGLVLPGEPEIVSARRGRDGQLLWEGIDLRLPGAVAGEMLISGSQNKSISLLSGETWMREQPLTGEKSNWTYSRAGKGCDIINASQHLLLFRAGDASYHDLEHDSGQGYFHGFRSGCTTNLIPADGVLSALDYTRTCNCSYSHQTSLAMVNMPDGPGVDFWTLHEGSPPDPAGFGLNFGAPGRRVDVEGTGFVWHDRSGTHRRHPSAIKDNGGGIGWVAASGRETSGTITINDLIDTTYTVRLHFAEPDEEIGPGERVFDVLIDGEKVLDGFDIVRQTGGALRGVVKEFSMVVEGSRMSLELRSCEDSQRDPVISGIEVHAEGYE